jgi:BlaI family transcriptional regulator, penicillinase repressor
MTMSSKSGELLAGLGRRERQIMEVIYQKGEATVAQVRAELPDPPSYSAVRGMLRLLESKRHVRYRRDGLTYVYMPTVKADRVRKSALRQMVETFFSGSPLHAVAALVQMPDTRISAADRQRLQDVLKAALEKESQ